VRALRWQADDVLPTAALQWIGGLRTYAARVQFFLGVQSVVPTVYHWVAFILLVVVPAAIAVDRVVLHPAQIIYNQHQNGDEGRSPNYRETMENQRRIEALHERLDELEE